MPGLAETLTPNTLFLLPNSQSTRQLYHPIFNFPSLYSYSAINSPCEYICALGLARDVSSETGPSYTGRDKKKSQKL